MGETKHRRLDVSSSQAVTNNDGPGKPSLSFPLAALLLPAKQDVSRWLTIPLVLAIAALFRWSLGIWGFSGYNKPPLYGDFEAQRHWIELTSHLPVSQWYYHDLQWWGLDYPPLTAYHSWFMGVIGGLVDKSFFALHTSRGLETQALKVFMRATVIVSEYLVYVPAVVLCVRRLSGSGQANEWQSLIALTAIMMQPATMLIDHGHFQYNTVMLGFVVASVVSILQSRPAQACVWFVAALGFKQMALFYAPAMFAYLLGSCVFPQININRLVQIATYTLSAFAALLAPFVLGVMYGSTRRDLEVEKGTATWLSSANLEHPVIAHLSQMVHRVFPFARGLFEDKVANVWCAIHSSGLYKLNRTDPVIMGRAALGLTLLSILPPCAIIFIRPRKDLVLLTLATSAWGFFLCSYQVHEKNVLLPLLPMTLLLADREGLCAEMRAWVGFANTLGCWTMFPLLKRDDLRIPYAVLTLLWTWLLDLPPVSMSLYGSESGLHNFTQLIHLAMYAAMALWHVAEAFMPPPERLPDIWVVANVCLGAAGFGICYLWCLWQLVTRSGLWSTTSKKPKTA